MKENWIATLAVAICISVNLTTTSSAEDNNQKTWKSGAAKMSEKDLKEKLTPMQYKVTQKDGTEPAFNNEYWNNHRAGIYVDVVSGEPLFASIHKYDSGSGWPAFYQPLSSENIVEKKDRSWLMERTEIRADWSALLHQLSRPPICPGRRSGQRRLRGFSRAVRAQHHRRKRIADPKPPQPGHLSVIMWR